MLADELESWSRRTGIDARFSTSGIDRVLPGRISHNLAAVLNETLSNIEKHARATLVRVSVVVMPDCLEMEIRDNGAGFSIDEQSMSSYQASGRLGLLTMKERAESVGGRFSIASSPDGTVVRITVPRTAMEQP
ncbi:MAG: hypothetical protein IBX68_10200 [Dehalococcoidia bacterium]|nr:hypothetical protein [Dehalococcoidia bacterium]